jgi:putative transposase
MYVNQLPEAHETTALRRCANRGSPYGDEIWAQNVAEQLGLESTLRPRGRPVKEKDS